MRSGKVMLGEIMIGCTRILGRGWKKFAASHFGWLLGLLKDCIRVCRASWGLKRVIRATLGVLKGI